MDVPESNKTSNSKVTWIIVGVVVALIVLGASVYAIIMAAMPRQENTNQTPSTATKTLTKEQVRQDLNDVSKTLEQEKADRKKAQQALDDNINRIKLSN